MFNADRFLPFASTCVFYPPIYFCVKVFRPTNHPLQPECIHRSRFFFLLFWLLQLTVTCTILTSGLEMSFEAMHSYEPDCSLVMAVSCKCCPSVTNLCMPAREREKEPLPRWASSRKQRPEDRVEHRLLTCKTHRRGHKRISGPQQQAGSEFNTCSLLKCLQG